MRDVAVHLPPLLPYLAVTAAGLGVALVLLVHRLAAGAHRTVAIALGLAAAVALAQAAPAGTGPLTAHDLVLAAFSGTVVLVAGLAAATLVAAPFPSTGASTGAHHRAGDGPRAVGLTLAAAVAAGLAVRLIVAGRPAGLDDAAAARLAGDPHLPAALKGSLAQPQPPLQTVLEWLTRHLLGVSPLAMRLPSLVAGVLLVPVVYAAAVELYGRRTALVAALVAAIGPGFIWLSADPGPAALTGLLTAVGLLGLVRALRRNRPADWVLLGLAGAGLVLAHQLGLATVAVLDGAALIVLVRRYRSERVAGADSPGRRDPAVRPAGAAGRTPAVRPAGAVGWAPAGLALAALLTAAAAVPLLMARHGFGPAAAVPPAEYATTAAPAGGGSPFGLAASAVAGVVGFHPPGVTSRLLALWPLLILAAFLLFGRRWSGRGLLLAGLAAAPFLALFLADLLGAPRQPPAALDWIAAALPALAIGIGRAVSLVGGPWRSARLVAAGLVVVLAVALVDQTVRVRPVARLRSRPALATMEVK